MKIIPVLTLFAALAHATLVPLNVVSPHYLLNPQLTEAEWAKIYANQSYTPEVTEDFQNGTSPQPDDAGVVCKGMESSIVGGSRASRGQFPWQVGITADHSLFCGGSIISSNWVLTAGHCVYRRSSFVLVFGSNHPEGGELGSYYQTSRSYNLHQQYDHSTLINDIALIYLNNPLSWTAYINPIRLPAKGDAGISFEGYTARSSGWGTTSDRNPGRTNNLMFADLLIVNNNICANHFRGPALVTQFNICTDGSTGRSTCGGDSGGPLSVLSPYGYWVQIGIVSFGSSEGCELGYPAVFTRVTSYLGWIGSITGITIRD